MSSSNRATVRPARPHGDAAPVEWTPEDLDAEREREARAPSRAEREAQERERRARELEEARAAGHAEGLEEGRRTERERLGRIVASIDAALEQVAEREAEARAALEENTIALALAVARHLIRREVTSDPEIVADLVRRALAEFPVEQPVRIRLHPEDLSLLSAAVSSDGEPLPITGGREARWLPDPNMARGGCVIEGRERIIDGRVDSAVDRIYWQIYED